MIHLHVFGASGASAFRCPQEGAGDWWDLCFLTVKDDGRQERVKSISRLASGCTFLSGGQRCVSTVTSRLSASQFAYPYSPSPSLLLSFSFPPFLLPYRLTFWRAGAHALSSAHRQPKLHTYCIPSVCQSRRSTATRPRNPATGSSPSKLSMWPGHLFRAPRLCAKWSRKPTKVSFSRIGTRCRRQTIP